MIDSGPLTFKKTKFQSELLKEDDHDWCRANKMAINTRKYILMQNGIICNSKHHFKLEDNMLSSPNNLKHLCTMLDKTLKYNDRVNNL